MARNIEIKARIESIESLLPVAAKIADEGPIEILQDDTFFSCPSGRLKLRAFSDHDGQLIFYQRPDSAGPKESFYVISSTSSPDTLRKVLSLAYGESGRVRKQRTLFLVGRTRVHLDKVEKLGDFLELEVVLAEGEPNEAGVSVAHELLEKLAVSQHQLIEEAYVDLLTKLPNEEIRQTATGIMNSNIYEASLEDFAHIQTLISKSAQILQSQYYKKSEIETALELVSGIEELIAAGSFLVAEYGKKIIGCGGWEINVSEPQKADIRGFFVHPDFARRGVATQLFIACENECLSRGIETLYLTATLSGEPFYKKCGFSEIERFKQNLSNGETFELVKMAKEIQCCKS